MILRRQRVGVFVDVQNMFYSAKYQYRSKLDFNKLLEFAVQERELVRAIAYVVQTPDIDQSNFLTMLQQTGYEVRAKVLKVRPDGSTRGGWDLGIALDMMVLSERLDAVVLVSGDGDFVDLVTVLRARGVRVEVASFPYSTAEELKLAATEFRPLGPGLLLGGAAFPYAANGVSSEGAPAPGGPEGISSETITASRTELW